MAQTEAQKRYLEEIRRKNSPSDLSVTPSLTEAKPAYESSFLDPVRTFGSGLLLGFGDELEAFVRSGLENRSYEEIRDEVRSRIKNYQDQNPGTALTLEVIGAIAPTAAMLLIPGGQTAAIGQASRLGSQGITKLIAKEAGIGGLSGYGLSEEESFQGQLKDIGIGTAVSAATAPVARFATEAVGSKLSQVTDWLRSKVGERASSAAMNEIQRLTKSLGKTPDEIVQDIADGKILAENKTLTAAVRAIRSKQDAAGSSPSMITQGLERRKRETSERAISAVESELSLGGKGRNVFRSMKAEDDSLQLLESAGYRKIFENNSELLPEVSIKLQDILKRFPNVRNELNAYYSESGKLVPLFKGDTSELARMPSLEDAEVAYRLLRDEASGLYSSGKNTRAGNFKEASSTLKNILDDNYQDLKNVRRLASTRRSVKDSFEAGRKAFGRDADELQIEYDELLKSNPIAAKAFKAGVLAQFKNKARRTQTTVGRAGDPDRQEGAILKVVMGKNYDLKKLRKSGDLERFTSIQKELETAGESQGAYQSIIHGSMTAPEQAASKAIGSGISPVDLITSAMALNNPAMVVPVLSQKLAQSLSNDKILTPKDYESITRVLMSENPKLVERFLTDKVSLGALINPIKKASPALGNALEKAAAFESAKFGVENRAGILGSIGVMP